jgi:hypothetical protein
MTTIFNVVNRDEIFSRVASNQTEILAQAG